MIRLSSLISEAIGKCPTCRGTGTVLSKTDQTRVQCLDCRGTGRRELREAKQVRPSSLDWQQVYGSEADARRTLAPGKVVVLVTREFARRMTGKEPPMGQNGMVWVVGSRDVREADTAGADQLGSYRGVAVEDPFAARIQLANTIRKFADAVESVTNTPQFDPQHDTYDSQGIDGFIETLGETQKLMFSVINFWKKRMANIDQAQRKEI